MSDICLAIVAPALFTGFFLAMGIMARRDRKEMERMERSLVALKTRVPDWSPVTNPLMKAWSEAQAALFLMEGM